MCFGAFIKPPDSIGSAGGVRPLDGSDCRGRKLYRPNTRSISQPSSPAAASGRTDVRVGAGRPTVPLADIGIGVDAEGGETCEDACTMFEYTPAGCEFGSGT